MGRRKKGEIQFRKVGGGSLRFKGQIIKPNQKFWANPDELSSSHMDAIVPVDKSKAETTQTKVEPVEYKLEPRGGGWFNIVNAKTGKRMNEKALKRNEALQQIKELSG